MKVDASIDKRALCQLLQAEYGLDVVALTLVPKGEEGYSYIAETPDARYFVKVYDDLRPQNLNARFQAASHLHTRCGLEYVVCARETRRGEFIHEFGEHALAVFAFVESTAESLGDEDWARAAALTASLHASACCPALPPLPRERFEITFKDWLLEVLAAAEENAPATNEYQRQAWTLLRAEKDGVLATLKKLEQLAERARAIVLEPILTHGDLNPDNILRDRQGNLHLIDWGKIAIAPPERDLICLAGERFELFLTHYARACERPPRLHPEIFEYYAYWLLLGGIADYGSWILLEGAGLAETEYAWEKFKQHLPIDHERAQAELDEISRVIRLIDGLFPRAE